jgi:hypothetical protein
MKEYKYTPIDFKKQSDVLAEETIEQNRVILRKTLLGGTYLAALELALNYWNGIKDGLGERIVVAMGCDSDLLNDSFNPKHIKCNEVITYLENKINN